MERGKDSTGSCFLYGPNKEAANDVLLILRPGHEAAGRGRDALSGQAHTHTHKMHV